MPPLQPASASYPDALLRELCAPTQVASDSISASKMSTQAATSLYCSWHLLSDWFLCQLGGVRLLLPLFSEEETETQGRRGLLKAQGLGCQHLPSQLLKRWGLCLCFYFILSFIQHRLGWGSSRKLVLVSHS